MRLTALCSPPQDAFYEFRLVAFAGSYISDPSNTVNVSTAGRGCAAPTRSSSWEAGTEGGREFALNKNPLFGVPAPKLDRGLHPENQALRERSSPCTSLVWLWFWVAGEPCLVSPLPAPWGAGPPAAPRGFAIPFVVPSRCWRLLWDAERVPQLRLPSGTGMEVYPSRTQLPELLPQPVLAGVIGGICFLSVAVIFSTVAACIMNRRRAARIQKRRQGRSQRLPGGARARGAARGGLPSPSSPLVSSSSPCVARRATPVCSHHLPDPPLVFSPSQKLPAPQ